MIQNRQMMLDDATPMRFAYVMYSVTAMHWGSSSMEGKQLDIKSQPVCLLFVDVVCSAACECLFKGRNDGGQKSQGKARLER